MDTNALFGAIVVFRVNNTHLKTLQKCFHTIAPEDNEGSLWPAESVIYVFNMSSKIHFLFCVKVCVN